MIIFLLLFIGLIILIILVQLFRSKSIHSVGNITSRGEKRPLSEKDRNFAQIRQQEPSLGKDLFADYDHADDWLLSERKNPTLDDSDFKIVADDILAMKPSPSTGTGATQVVDKPTVIIEKKSFTNAALQDKANNLSRPVNHQVQHIVLFLRAAKDCAYEGYELLQALLANDCRFGKNNLFHRFDSKNDQERICFSIAAATAQGTFDLYKMGDFTCRGLSLFFILQEVEQPMQVFEAMLACAQQLIEDLGGVILDERQQPLNEDKIAAIKAEIRALELSQLNEDFFISE